jgi:peptidoglycan/LPS O-acetylase OafA/YrhL
MQGLSEKVRIWPAIVAVAAVIYVALILLTDPDGAGRLVSIGIFALVVVSIVGLGVYGGFAGDQPYRLERFVPLPRRVIEEQAVRWFATTGWTLTGSRSDALAFTRRVGPDFGPTLLLFLLGVLPGLIYLWLGGRTQTATVLTSPAADGPDLEIVLNTRAGGGQSTAINFFNSLHELVDPASSGNVSLPAHRVP